MTTELATVTDSIAVSVEQFDAELTSASNKAKILAKVVTEEKLAIQLKKNSPLYLKAEAWLFIGKGYGYTPKSEVTELYHDESGKCTGAKATATILDMHGVAVGGAESFCFASEQGKSDQVASQLAGMAQTRAISRALKQLLSWVVILAGYSPTPWDEIAQTPLENTLKKETTQQPTTVQATVVEVTPSELPALLDDLDTLCPVHHDDWVYKAPAWEVKEGDPSETASHQTDGGWCNMAPVFKGIVASNLGVEDINSWVRDTYGKTWSKLEPTQMCDAVRNTAKTTNESPISERTATEEPSDDDDYGEPY